MTRDRFDYVNAASDSWRRQMLINVVKLRYYDSPVFLEVTAIINRSGGLGMRVKRENERRTVVLFSLTETGGQGNAPIVTVPTN